MRRTLLAFSLPAIAVVASMRLFLWINDGLTFKAKAAIPYLILGAGLGGVMSDRLSQWASREQQKDLVQAWMQQRLKSGDLTVEERAFLLAELPTVETNHRF